MSRVKIALVGAGGRMGLEIVRACSASDSPVEIGGAVEHAASSAVGRDLGELSGLGKSGVVCVSDPADVVSGCDVVVDLSLPAAFEAVLEETQKAGKPLVSGTTGLSASQLDSLERAGRQIAVLHTTNLSLGVALLGQFVERAASLLGPGYDIEVVEAHHRFKQDAPSGTALTLVQRAAAGRGLDADNDVVHGRQGRTGTRAAEEIGVHAVRGGTIFGTHTVTFAGEDETIELTHRAGSRRLFALGAVRAAAFLAGKKPGIYTMADVLSL